MIQVRKEGVLLEKTEEAFEVVAVLNPAVIQEGAFVHLFYRAVGVGNFSSIGYCKLLGPFTVIERLTEPLLLPEHEYESHGIEDPRIVKIDNLYYLTYTAFDGVNALGALAVSTDLKHWKKYGLLVPKITFDEFYYLATFNTRLNEKYLRYNEHDRILKKQGKKMFLWDKNLIFFPRRINGKLYFLHRIKPDIQIIVGIEQLEELTNEFWQKYFLNFNDKVVLTPKYEHEVSYIGGGCPPIETTKGWLVIYHGVRDSIEGYIYSACAALLDLEHPEKEIARLPYPLFEPEKAWEKRGEVNNVCFPTGTALFDDTLYIYYGAADELIAYVSLSLSVLLNELTLNPIQKDE